MGNEKGLLWMREGLAGVVGLDRSGGRQSASLPPKEWSALLQPEDKQIQDSANTVEVWSLQVPFV